MKSITYKDIITLMVVAVAVFVIGFMLIYNPFKATGSIGEGQSYNATSTVPMTGTWNQLKYGQGDLGSVVVASTSATVLRIWNATSSTDVASTSPVHFVASPANGTYQFDATFDRGIIVERVAGFNGAYTITWR